MLVLGASATPHVPFILHSFERERERKKRKKERQRERERGRKRERERASGMPK